MYDPNFGQVDCSQVDGWVHRSGKRRADSSAEKIERFLLRDRNRVGRSGKPRFPGNSGTKKNYRREFKNFRRNESKIRVPSKSPSILIDLPFARVSDRLILPSDCSPEVYAEGRRSVRHGQLLQWTPRVHA